MTTPRKVCAAKLLIARVMHGVRVHVVWKVMHNLAYARQQQCNSGSAKLQRLAKVKCCSYSELLMLIDMLDENIVERLSTG